MPLSGKNELRLNLPIAPIDGQSRGEQSTFIELDIPSKNPLASHSVLAFFCLRVGTMPTGRGKIRGRALKLEHLLEGFYRHVSINAGGDVGILLGPGLGVRQ